MKTLLLVDDRPENLRLLRKILSGNGYRLRETQSAEEALAAAEHGMPDLILMDLRLPGGMTGYEAAGRIRTLPGGGEVIIIAVSASPTNKDEQNIRQAGFDGFILKPIDAASFPGLVASYLARGRPR